MGGGTEERSSSPVQPYTFDAVQRQYSQPNQVGILMNPAEDFYLQTLYQLLQQIGSVQQPIEQPILPQYPPTLLPEGAENTFAF